MSNLEDYNGASLLGVSVTFLILTIFCVSLRCWVRIKITKAFAWDDGFMVISLIIFMLSCAFIWAGLSHGLGHHNDALTVDNQIDALKYQALATITYIANMMFIKLSIAIFLLRIVVDKVYMWILYISMAVVALFTVSVDLLNIFQCTPLQAQWDFRIQDSKCLSGDQFVAGVYAVSVMSVVTDWLYALLPIPMIWGIQMSQQAKLTVGFILSLGIFASVATLIRIKYLLGVTSLNDILYTGTGAMIWTLIEPGVAIIAASLVTIRPLLRAWRFPGFGETTHRHFYPSSTGFSTHPSVGPLVLRNDIPHAEEGELCSITAVSSGQSNRNAIGGRDGCGNWDKRLEGRMDEDTVLVELTRKKTSRGSMGTVIGVTRTVEVMVHHESGRDGRNRGLDETCSLEST